MPAYYRIYQMRLLTFLTSRGFAIFLLAISAGMLVIWRGRPQYYSPVFLIIPLLLFLSICFCIVKRIIARGAGWDRGFCGSFIFHAGLLVIIAAASIGPLTRFWATVILPQGMTVSMEDKAFAVIRNIPIGGASPDISMKMDGYEARYADDRFPIDYAAHATVLLMEKGIYRQRGEDIRINAPLWLGGYQFLLEEGLLAPLFILRNKDGNEIFKRFVRVSNEITTEDRFDIPGVNLVLYTRFFPDVYKEGGKYGSRSPYPRNPAFGIRVTGKNNPFKDIWKGVLKKGEKAEFEGMNLEVADIKPVVILQVMGDPTYWGVFAGWLLIAGGLTMRYLPLEKASRRKTKDMADRKYTAETGKNL